MRPGFIPSLVYIHCPFFPNKLRCSDMSAHVRPCYCDLGLSAWKPYSASCSQVPAIFQALPPLNHPGLLGLCHFFSASLLTQSTHTTNSSQNCRADSRPIYRSGIRAQICDRQGPLHTLSN